MLEYSISIERIVVPLASMTFVVYTDADECLKKGVCHEQAQCYNLPGSFKCLCMDGYYGDGQHCQGKPFPFLFRL